MNHIDEKKIRVYNNSVVLELSNVEWSKVQNTTSIIPVLRYNSFVLEKPINLIKLDEPKPGDIITFYYPKCNCKVVHRIINIGYDDYG